MAKKAPETPPITIEGFERFAMVPEWLYSHPDASPQAIAAWIALWHYADRESHRTIVRRKLLAELAAGSPSPATIDRWIAQLEELGAVEITARFNDSGQASNEYLLRWTRPDLRTPLLTDEEAPLRESAAPPSAPMRRQENKNQENENHPDQELAPAPPAREDAPAAEIVRVKDSSPDLPTSRPRRPIWDALEDVFLYRPQGAEAAFWGKFVKRLEAENVDPDEVAVRARRLVARWGTKTLTVPSLAKHWDWLGTIGALDIDSRDFEEKLAQEARDRQLEEAFPADPRPADAGTDALEADRLRRQRMLTADIEADPDDFDPEEEATG